jgi:hypothetical protein
MKDRKNSSLLRRLEKFQRLFFVALLSVLAVGAFAQSKTVSGTVLDKTGESVIGASVVVKGTTKKKGILPMVQLPTLMVSSHFRMFLIMERSK